MPLALICGCAKNDKKPYPTHQLTEWNNMGLRTSVLIDFENNQWCLSTQKEAARYAIDIGWLFIDDRLLEADAVVVRTNWYNKWMGWKVLLNLPNGEHGSVEMTMEDNGRIRHIKSSGGPFHGSPSLGRTLMSVHHWSADSLGWDTSIVAALTAVDVVRVLSDNLVNLYVNRIDTNSDGDWLINVGDGSPGYETFFGVRLSRNFYLLDYDYKP